MSNAADATGEAVIIKKYANRRLYNTQSSSYITLDHLAKMTREGVEFRVVDAKSGADITHQILTQIIMEEEAGGEQMLPVSFLRQLIAMYGNSMQALLPQYLETSMTHFCANQEKMREAFGASMAGNPLAQLAEQNMAMLRAATSAFIPDAAPAQPAKPEAAPAPASGGDLDALRAQMAEMQKRLDALGK